jgi:hypothetical protein
MTIRFVCDRIVNGRAYPALTTHTAEPYTRQWKQFIDHYPRTVPAELLEYCNEHDVAYELYTTDNFPANSYYIVHLGFFDFAVDYIGLLPLRVFDAVKQNRLRILFYYHEGDNPFRIKDRLDSLCAMYGLNYDSYKFVSGNTAAADIANFVWFADHELLYYTRNKNEQRIVETPGSPMKVFTALNRTHKWWRATAVADLHRRGLLDNSYWSYNTDITIEDQITDCPIEIDRLNIRDDLMYFISKGPYRADTLSADDHNNHAVTVEEHYTNSYCNIVFETVFDADQSGGAFLTEKTFKPIKHGQAFVIAGPAGTLRTLRSLGYRTFDSAIDTSYDSIQDNTERWIALRQVIESIKHGNLELFRRRCAADVEHNQALFLTSKADRLNMLFRKIHND